MSNRVLDCIIIGYNDVDVQLTAENVESAKNVSGAYKEITYNTVLVRGKRLNYMNLLNTTLREAVNKDYRLHVMELPNLAVSYLNSFLIKRGLDVEFINFYNEEKERLLELLRQRPRAVAITTTFYVEPSPIIEIVRFVQQHSPETIVIVGGPYVFNVCSEQDYETQTYIFKSIGANIYIYDSQGEATLAKLLQELRKGDDRNLSSITNLIYHKKLDEPSSIQPPATRARRNLNVVKTGSLIRTQKEVEENILDENIIDWAKFSKDYYTPTVQMRTARSCAFKCAFCSYPVMAGPLTLTSLEMVEKEMRQLQEDGARYLVFIDDTFNVPLPRFKKLLKMMIKNSFDFNWVSYFRCSNSDDEAIDLMAESNCKGVFLGIESGDNDMLVKMNKHAAVEKYEYGIKRLNERGVITFASLIVGFPGETPETVRNTMDFIERAQPTFYRAEMYYHRTNLPIHQQADTYGLRGGGYSWSHNTMTWQEACDQIEMMYRNIKGSTVLPESMFDFWSIPYLLGKGISKEHIIEFMKRAQKLLFTSLYGVSMDDQDEDQRSYQDLVALSKEISHDLDACSRPAL